MAFPKNIKRRAGHRACLREMTDQTHPIYASTSNFSRASFEGTFFGSWKQRFLKEKLKKKDWKVQSLDCREQFDI